jgi:hypothetical protein
LGKESFSDGGVEGRVAVNEGLQNNGVLPDVYLEGIRGPTTDALDCVVRDSCESQGCSAAGTKRMTTYFGAKGGLEAGDKPSHCGREAERGDPELRVIREEGFAGGNVALHTKDRVKGGSRFGKNNNFAPLIEAVGFVER